MKQRCTRKVWVLLLTACLAGPFAAGAARAERFRFAALGDVPYNQAERALMPAMFDTMAAAPFAFAVHVGDIKAGDARCEDSLYRDRRAMFNAAPWPLIYTPGDNDWTDCHRRSNGSFDPLERLATLRRGFYPDAMSLGRAKMALERQQGYPENVRWRRGRIVFITLNTPGSQNNWGEAAAPSADFLARGKANAEWLDAAFALAQAESAKAVMILMQGNPDFETAAAGTPRPGYRELLAQFVRLAKAYAGQIVLVHGDTHIHRVDQPLRDPADGARIANFTRVEVWGSPFMGWVDVSVDDEAAQPFRFQSRLYSPARRR